MADDRPYPLRTFHDFISAIDEEWSRFRMGSLMGFLTSAFLVFFILRWIVDVLLRLRAAALRPRMPIPIMSLLDLLLVLGALIAVAYSSYALYRQYRFFEKWEKRIGLLRHFETQLLEENQ
jgi:hypothetical protein